MSDNPADLSLCEVVDHVRSGYLSAVSVTIACLDRAEKNQMALNAFVEIEHDDALKMAASVDDALARGDDPGPLAGVPLAHKDMYYRPGKTSGFGAVLPGVARSDLHSTVLRRLDAAGAVNLGRLHMTELANGSTGHNVHVGDCHNPWSIDHAPGASSSGNGAAVAARLVAGGMGSDVGGSIRIPASMCGIVGLRPTQTRVTRHGTMPLAHSLDCCGPMTRTVRDAARILRVVAGFDPMDPTTSRRGVADYEASVDKPVTGMRIGIPVGYYDTDVESDVLAAMAAAKEVYERLGINLVKVQMPDHEHINQLWNVIQLSEVASAHKRFLQEARECYSPEIRRRIETGMFITAADYLRACMARARITRDFVRDIFNQCDALLTPTLPLVAPPLDAGRPGGGQTLAQWHATILRISGFTRPATFLGLPAMSLPAGFSATGLPVGQQLIARPFAEPTLFQLGAAYQAATDWHDHQPQSGFF